MIFEFDDFRLDAARRELRRAGTLVPLEPQVFDLLHFIVRERERVVSKEDLVADVWKGRIVSDSTLSSRITAARKAVGDSGDAQRLIRTMPRKGIRFIGEVRELDDSPRLPPAPLAAPAAAGEKPSLAVLPFDNMSSDAQLGFLADGIAEDIITALARFPSFTVIARNSSFSFRGQPVDVGRVGRELGVRYVLEGSVRAAGHRIRVTGQLVDAQTRGHLWAEKYDCERSGLFEVQDEITHAVVTSLAPAITHEERQRAARKPPASLDAWSAYQRGMWHLAQGTSADNDKAAGFFRQAIDKDPLFAGGYVGLSAVLGRAKGTQREEEELAMRAVALDARNAEARARLALALLARGEHARAEEEARQALALCPGLSAAHGALGVVLAYAGRPREGLAALQECLRLDPRGPFLVNRLNQLALAHYFCGNWAEAAEAAARASEAFPSFPSPHRWRAAALGQLGRLHEAREALAEAIRLSPAEFDFQVKQRPAWFSEAGHAQMLDGLRKAGW